MYKIIFKKTAKKQLAKLDKHIQKTIQKVLKTKLAVNPEEYLRPLTCHNKEFWKFRSGDYRLICTKNDEELHVLVFRVGHRRNVYLKLNSLDSD